MGSTESERAKLFQTYDFLQLSEKANAFPGPVNVEIVRRQIETIEKFNKTSSRSANIMIALTIIMTFLTVAIAALTVLALCQ
jgi:hypothetical protein